MAKPMNPDKPKPYSMFAEMPEAAWAMKYLAAAAALRGSVEELTAILEVQRGIHKLLGRVRKLEDAPKFYMGIDVSPDGKDKTALCLVKVDGETRTVQEIPNGVRQQWLRAIGKWMKATNRRSADLIVRLKSEGEVPELELEPEKKAGPGEGTQPRYADLTIGAQPERS